MTAPRDGNGDGVVGAGEDRFRTAFAHAAVGMAVTDAEGRFLEANPAYCRITGYTEDELRRLDFASMTHPDDRPGNRERIRRMCDGAEPGFVLEKRYLCKGGGVAWVKASVSLVRDGRGRPHRIVALIEDLSERRRAEEHHRESEELTRLLLDSTGEAIYGVDTGGLCTFCNPACVRLLGYDRPEDLLGRNMHDLIHHGRADGTPYPEVECRIYRAFRRGEGTLADDEVFWRADGSAFPVEYRSHPIRRGGEVIGSVVTFADIAGRKRAEATIAEQVRLAEYGRDVGRALTQGGTLEEVLDRCAGATVRHLDGAFARIWVVDEAGEVLVLGASAGMYTHTDGPHARIPVGQYKIGQIALERQPHLTNAVIGDPRIPAQDWARAEGMVAFAGYPLVVEGRLVGVLAMFARRALSGATLRAMASVADEIAVGIERQRAQARLHQQRQWLRVTLASIGDAVIATGTDGRITFLNGVAEALTGWGRSDAEGRPLAEVFRIVNEQSRGEVESPADRALREGTVVGLANHTVLIARDGTERAIDDSAAPIRDEAGAVIGAVLIFRDVDERRRAERALEQSEARKAAVLDTALDAIVTMDHEGRVVEWNPAAERTFGYPRREILGREMAELIIPPSLREDHRRGLARFLATGEGPVLGQRIELTAVRAGGEEFPAELAITRIPVDGPPLFTAHIRDDTERVQADRALRDGERRFRHLADAVPQIVWEGEPDGAVSYYNRRWYDYTGQTPEEALQPDGWRDVVHPDDLAAVDAAGRRLGLGEVFEAEYRLRGRDGAYRWHLGRAVPVRGVDGRVVRRYGTATDIDDRRRAEQVARFLAEASAALAGLVDYEETLRRVAGMAVPAFADWCAVDVLGGDGRLRRLAVEHADPERLRLAHELFEKYPPRPDDPHGIFKVLRTGESELVEQIPEALLEAIAYDAEHLRLARALGLRSYVCVPLRPRGGSPGVLTFVTAGSGRDYGPGDLHVAEDLARRATTAVENAELYRALQEADRGKGELLASLRDSEERFRTMADSIPQLAWMARADGHIVWYNQRWHEYTGTTPEEMEGWGWQSVHDPDVLPSVLERWRGTIASGEPFDMVFPLRGADGRYRPFLTRVMPVRDAEGRVAQWFGTNTDVSEAKRAEEAQREARCRLEALLAAGEVGTWEYDVLGDTVRADPNLARMFGVTPEEAAGGPIAAYLRAIHPEDRERVTGSIGRALRAGPGYEAEYRLVGPDGDIRRVVARGRVERDGAGRAIRLPGVVVDVTAQRQAEETLRIQHELTRAITDNATTSIFMTDERGRCIFMNPAAEAMTGYAFAEVEGRVLHDLIHHTRPDGTPYPASECPIDRALPGRFEVRDHEDLFLRRDGSSFPVLCNARPVRDGGAGTVVEVRDITERKRFEDELRHAKEEAEAANRAKTQFLAVLSHELRTPLNPILLAASSMLERPASPEELRPTLQMIRQNVLLQARLIDDLLDVMRIVRGKMPLHWEVADCHKLLDQAVQVCRSEVLGHHLRLEVRAEARRRHVNADPARLQQVFWNLIRNAVKFTPEGGRVLIRTSNPADPGPAEGWIVVEVSDTGIGIEPGVLPVIFDPFQQGETTITRKFGGLGLGLAICKGIVDAHGGTIAAESEGKGRGTTFRVTLKALPEPADEADGRPDRGRAEVADAPPASLRILAVEDEPTTLRLMARLLRGLGHEVATAGSVAEAAQIFGAGEFDLIVSDIGLPDGTGLDLMRRAVALRGPVAAIALTGYGMEEDIRRSREAGFTAHLTKPIDFAKLEAMIRRVTSAGP